MKQRFIIITKALVLIYPFHNPNQNAIITTSTQHQSLLNSHPRIIARLANTRLSLLLPTLILPVNRMSTLTLTRTLRHASRKRARVRRSSVRGSLGSVSGARDFEVLAVGVVNLAVFGRAEDGWCWFCGAGVLDDAGVRGGGEGPFVEEVHDCWGGVHVVLDKWVSEVLSCEEVERHGMHLHSSRSATCEACYQ